MAKVHGLMVAFVGVLVLTLAARPLAADDSKVKEKPKDAATLDDRTGSITKTTDGKEEKTKVELKYCLKVKGFFAKDGFHIEELDDDGPAAMLQDEAGNSGVKMEAGDVITQVDGKSVKSPKAYAKAINGVADSKKIKVKVRDVNTGNETEFYASAAEAKP